LVVAPYCGLAGEAEMEAVGAAITVTVVVLFLVTSSLDVAVMVTLPGELGAVQVVVPPLLVVVGLKVPLPDHVTLPVFPPLVVVLNVEASFELVETVTVDVPTVIALTTTGCGVTATELST